MNDAVHNFFDICLKDDIVHIVFKAEHYTEEITDAAIKYRLSLTKDKHYPMFSDVRKMKRFSRAARQRLVQKDSLFGTKCVAILSHSKVQRVQLNFFGIMFPVPIPVKIFAEKEKALEWLHQFR